MISDDGAVDDEREGNRDKIAVFVREIDCIWHVGRVNTVTDPGTVRSGPAWEMECNG